MWPGQLVAGRYRVERHVGAGGMGAVYLAADEAATRKVALKVLPSLDEVAARRFDREANLLASLDHPGIVAYAAHGKTEEGELFIAMEWLEGEDLSIRLARGPVSIADALDIANSAAAALAYAHAKGVVHRDVKPSNLLAVGGDVRRIKLLDFGIARVWDQPRFTLTGEGIGTPGYMAPEHARGEPTIDARADVFSLGCVLFECIAGRAPFVAEHVIALLAKVVFEDPPRLSDLAAHVPPPVDELIARMLEKDPSLRPRDGAALLGALEAVGRALGRSEGGAASVRSITRRERRFVAAVVIDGLAATPPAPGPRYDIVRALAAEHAGRFEPVRGGSGVVLFGGQPVVADGAGQAARFALALSGLLPDARFGVAMAHTADEAAAVELGAVLDRAANLLHGEPLSIPPSLRRRLGTPPPILVDEVAAGFLDVGFALGGRAAPYALLGERPPEEMRTLLGRPTRCVGREAELRTLAALVDGAIEGPAARAAVVTAPAGAGKSRLRVELVRRLRERGVSVQVWLGRAGQATRAAPFALIGQVLERLSGMKRAAEPSVRRQRIRALAAGTCDPADADRVAAFLGEIAGASFSDEDSVALRTARADPTTMGDHIRLAWEDFVAGATKRDPVLLLLEDVHWADAASLRLVEGTLKNLAEHPIAVVATMRPEGRDALPRSWIDGGVQILPLPALGKKAVAQLCTEALGERGGDVADDIARLGGGNAFHVEELIRAAARGDRATPRTVLAMLEARFDALDAESRMLLRAASVYGERFSEDGVVAIVSDRLDAARVRRLLGELCTLEVLERGPAGSRSFAFRHALVREAAYQTLTAEDRVLAHKLAARWLETSYDPNALVLAEHFDLGEEHRRALAWYVRGGERALEAHDLATARHCVARGRACGAAGAVLGVLHAIEAEALQWQGDALGAAALASEAMALLERGSAWWARATAPLLGGALAQGGPAPRALVDDLLALPNDRPEHWVLVARTAAYIVLANQPAVLAPLLVRLEEIGPDRLAEHPLAAGWAACTRSLVAGMAGDTERALVESLASEAMFGGAGDLRSAGIAQVNNGCFSITLGDWPRALAISEDVLGRATRAGWSFLVTLARANLGLAGWHLGRREEGRRHVAAAEDEARAAGDQRTLGTLLCYRAWFAERDGDVEAAEAFARTAVKTLEGSRPLCLAKATLARALLAGPRSDERVREALSLARGALDHLVAVGGIDEGESLVRLTRAEAEAAASGEAAAREHFERAAARVLARASRIGDPALRRSFLEAVPENARTLALVGRRPDTLPG
jgi:hypothetical protein